MNKVVATDGKAVAIACHLPYTELGMTGLHSCCDSSPTSVNRIKTIRIQIMWHTARTTDTRDNHCLMSRHTHFRHGFLQCHADSMVATTGTELHVLIALKLICFHTIYYKVFLTKLTIRSTANGCAVISLYCNNVIPSI